MLLPTNQTAAILETMAMIVLVVLLLVIQLATPEEGGADGKGNPSEGYADANGNHPSEEKGGAPISFQNPLKSHLMNFIANNTPHVSDYNEYPSNTKHHLGKNRAQLPLRKPIGNDIDKIRLNMNEQWNINESNKKIGDEMIGLNRDRINRNDLQTGKQQEIRQN